MNHRLKFGCIDMKYALHLLLIGLIISICGCEKVCKDADNLSIDFSWSPRDRGSNENPEIHVKGFPESTKYFQVDLKDLNVKSYPHGGGTVDNDGSGVIARGSIKGEYIGPNPPPGRKNDYEIAITAYDENDKIVGIGRLTKKFPPD